MANRAFVADTASASRSMPDASLIRSNSQNLVSWEGTLSAHPTVAGPKALARRSFDVLIAASVLLFALPLLVTIFALLKIQEGGPALLGEWRVGRGGRMFRRWKFQAEPVDLEDRATSLSGYVSPQRTRGRPNQIHNQILQVNPETTSVGRFLLQSGLDDLPQLLNVILGDMSIVGPRPIAAAEIRKYDRRYKYYVNVRPGIIGLWQVSGRDRTTYRRRLASDEVYFRRWSFGLDLMILLRAFRAVLGSDGSY